MKTLEPCWHGISKRYIQSSRTAMITTGAMQSVQEQRPSLSGRPLCFWRRLYMDEDVDTMRRYIYIHSCPETEPMGIAASHGCIRMRNADIVELFDQVESGSPVLVEE